MRPVRNGRTRTVIAMTKPSRPAMVPELPVPTLEQYGLVGHLPRCRAVGYARLTGTADVSKCDCGAAGPNDHDIPVLPARWREDR